MPAQPVHVGAVFTNRRGLRYEVIEDLGLLGNSPRRRHFRVRFIDSGFEVDKRSDSVRSGEVRDRKARTRLGGLANGSVPAGFDRSNPANRRLENIWQGMIGRCYDPTNPGFRNYSSKGVRVCDRWLVFSNFVDDFPKLPGYSKWVENPLYQLDKDKLGDGLLYSPETCCLISHEENTRLAHCLSPR